MWWIFSDSNLLVLTLIGAVLYLLYYYGTHTYGYWKSKGIASIEPKYPYLGTTYESVLSLKCSQETNFEIYNRFKSNRFVGIYSLKEPTLFITDPSLVESVMIRDFTSFYNRGGGGVDTKLDPLSAHLLNLENQQWKSLRSKLSPTFSSGKLKLMLPQLVECAEGLVKYVDQLAKTGESMDVREVMAKFTTDVIGSCAFGLNTKAMEDPESEFRKMGKKIFQPSFTSKIINVVRRQYPQLIRILFWIRRIGRKQDNFFVKTLRETMKFREENNLVRNDFVQLMMELKKQEIEKQKTGVLDDDHLIIDDNVIASNALIFFVAGFETTASTLSYCLYELSINQEIQEMAYLHVVSVLKKYGGEVTYDAIKEMTFIHKIFSETLRMHPPVPAVRRTATKDYMVPGTKLILPKGSSVLLPIHSLHYDPEYFHQPEKFKPERFSKEENIKKGTYMPFGDGPRICIGKRFAEMEMQVALVKLLLNYKFTLNPKTISPLIYNPSALLLVPIGGIWVDVQERISL